MNNSIIQTALQRNTKQLKIGDFCFAFQIG